MVQNQEFTHSQIAAQVNKISKSSALKNSPVLCQFLHFVVDETLEGNGERIKEYTIGTKVLGRKSDFDPQLDAIVRIHAGRLRRALNEFYSGEGKSDVMRISIPKGGYTPNFTSNWLENLTVPHAMMRDKSRRPVLAVMPFRNISLESSYDFFCQGLGEFASTELARLKELSLLSYSSCVNAAGKTKDISEMCSLLGAEYILTGSAFVDHENLRMLLQLSRCDSGRQLWSSALVRKVTALNLFEIQEEIISLITAALGGYYGVIYKDVIDASRSNGNYSDMDAYNVIFWYEQFTKQYDSDTFSKACESVEFTVKKDPEDALASAVLSELYAIGVVMGFKRLDDQKEMALTLANKAVKLDPMCQHAYQALARAYFLTGNKSGVVSASERCYALNPRAASFSARVGVFLIYAGEFDRGASILKQSLTANPYFPWVSSLAFSLYHFHRQEFQASWSWAEKADMPQIPWVNLIKAASMAQLGKLDQAKKEIEMLLVLKPDITVLGRPYIASFILDESLVDNIIAGLEKIGLIIQANTSLSNPS